jgi:hypothetical protein
MLLAAAVAMLAACGGAETPPTTPTRYVSPADPAADCPLLLECHGQAVNDRCPEPFLEFQATSSVIAPRTVVVLEALVAEIRVTPQLEQLHLQGFSSPSEDEGLAGERATAIRDWLVAEGVSDDLLDITGSVSEREQTTYVAIDVACGGSADDDDAAADGRARSSVGALSNVLF